MRSHSNGHLSALEHLLGALPCEALYRQNYIHEHTDTTLHHSILDVKENQRGE